LAVSEPADFVHVYDVTGGLREVQLLDFFGNIGGIAFSPDGSRLTVALADTMFGCLVDFQTSHLPLNTYK
jgi:Tol biopolymer transport system component